MKKKNKNGKNLNTKVAIQKKNTLFGNIKRNWGKFSIMCTLFLLLLSTNSSKSTEREAKDIINRAIELTDYIPHQNDRVNILGFLEKMKITHLDKKGLINVPADIECTLMISPKSKMSGQDEITQADNIPFMAFHDEALLKYGKIVVLMSDNTELTKNLDIKASSLIHELVHALQTFARLQKKEKPSKSMIYADEMQAWESQVFILSQCRPELFQGLSCDCEHLQILNMNDEQRKIIENDRMAQSLILFAYCKSSFLEKIYNKQ